MQSPKFIILILVFIVLGLGGGFLYWFTSVRPQELASGLASPAELCAPFPKVEDEVSCEEAVARALAQYPGTVWEVFIGPAKSWVIDIQLQRTTDRFTRVEIPIDVKQKR